MSRTNLNNGNNYSSPPPSYEDVCGDSASRKNSFTGEHETIAVPRADTATPTSEVTESSARLINGRTDEFYRLVPTIEITEAGEPEDVNVDRHDVSIPIYDNGVGESELPTYDRAIRQFDSMSPASRITRSQEIPQIIRVHNYGQTPRSAGHTPTRQTMSQWQEYLRRNEQLRLRNEDAEIAEAKTRAAAFGITLVIFFALMVLIGMGS